MKLDHLGGAGKNVVMLHGFGSDSLSWAGTAPALFPNACVYAVDLPFHGKNTMRSGYASIHCIVDGLIELIKDNDLQAVNLVGHSLGGALSMMIAARQAELVASLTLLAPAGLGRGLNEEFLTRFPQLSSDEDTLALLQTLVNNPKLISKQLVPMVLAQLDKTGIRENLASLATDLLKNGDRELAIASNAIQLSNIPRLLIWGQNDHINPCDHSRLTDFGGQLVMIENCGHLPHVEQRVQVNAFLSKFLT